MVRAGLACAASIHATWQSVNESRYAVLDSFFWRSRTEQLSITGAESFLPPDPRLDHEVVVVSVSGESIGKMPPLEPLRRPVRLKMQKFAEKRTEWQAAVTRPVGTGIGFTELERVKQIVLDCARTIP